MTVQKAKCPKIGNIFNLFDSSVGRHLNAAPRKSLQNKTPKVVSVGCVGLWKHNGVLSRLMEQNKTKHPLALSRVEPGVTKFDKVPMF